MIRKRREKLARRAGRGLLFIVATLACFVGAYWTGFVGYITHEYQYDAGYLIEYEVQNVFPFAALFLGIVGLSLLAAGIRDFRDYDVAEAAEDSFTTMHQDGSQVGTSTRVDHKEDRFVPRQKAINIGDSCPNCRNQVQRCWVACPFCCQTLQSFCEHCGNELEKGWDFCPFCDSTN